MRSANLMGITLAALFAIALATPLAAQQQTKKNSRYILKDLGTLGGSYSQVNTFSAVINEKGTVVGSSDTSDIGNSVKVGKIWANVLFGRTGIQATPGQVFGIEAMGRVNVADQDGPYITNATGTITVAPPVGSGAYQYFTDNASPIGLPPAVGMQKFPLGGSQLDVAAFGALVAGFASIPNPTSLSDFPSGFQLIGTSGTATAPSFGGYLFLAVNDINNTGDNAGYYLVRISF
jgi:hypothetical protein